MKRYFEGDEAQAIGETTQNILMNYLRGKLQERPDVAALCPEGVLVTSSLATARNRFKTKENGPFVLIQEAGHDEEFERVRVVDGDDIYLDRGARHSWLFELQLSARNDEAARTGPSNVAVLDRKLADIVCDIFITGYLDLLELGLTVTDVKGNKRNPNDPNKINPQSLWAESVTREGAVAP